jgi:hypothetical protein
LEYWPINFHETQRIVKVSFPQGKLLRYAIKEKFCIAPYILAFAEFHGALVSLVY